MSELRCRNCGCTEDNACTARTSTGKVIGCSWIEPDLCSACTPGARKIWQQPIRSVASVMSGAIVECDVRGLVFKASVTGSPAAGVVEVDPPQGITYRRLRARQVRRLLQPAPRTSPQLQLDGA